jgi:uncharacterized protein (DUF2062 family)
MTVMGSIPPRTLLLIPVFNHANSLRRVVRKSLDTGLDVLVVDDGSTDGGLETVSDLPIARRRFPGNRGKGAAILAAAELARQGGYEALLTVDADGQHDPAEAGRLLEAAAPCWPAIAVGARRMDGAHVPPSSVFGRNFSNFWVRLECGQSLPDSQSGFRLYPVELLVGDRFLSRRYPFEVEVLVRAAWSGVPIVSVPVSVHYPPRGERISHFRPVLDNLRLTALHAWLVTRSLLPWPHRRPSRGEERTSEAWWILHPVKLLRRLSAEHTGTAELAAAVWVGIFIGALPIIPFGIATIVYVSHRLHLNKMAGVAASNVCCAPFVPFLCVEAGHFLTNGRFLSVIDWHSMVGQIHLRLWEWLLGALIVGPILGSAGALVTFLAVRSLRMEPRQDARTAGG